MSSDPSDEDLMKNVFQLKERLMQTENSLQKINKITEMDVGTDAAIRMSFSEPHLHSASESVNLPPPLTLDDLGELTTHDETDYSPVNESVLRKWNMNSDRQGRHSKASSRSPSPEYRAKASRTSSESIHSAHGFHRNLKNPYSPRKLRGPSTSSPNIARYRNPGSRAYSCDDLTHAADIQVFGSDSYRMLKKPSVTSNFSISAPISPRKSLSRRRDPSPSYSDILDRHSGFFEPMEGVTSDQSASTIEEFTLMTSKKSPDDSADTTVREQGKENVTPRPISARSNATSVTMLGTDAESDRLQGRLSMLREDNARLHALVSDLRQQLEMEKSRNDDHKSRIVENLQENILALKEEAQANEKALRNAEESLERSEMICQKKIENLVALKDELSHVKSILTETELAKESLAKQHKETYQDAQELARQLESAQEKLHTAERDREKSEARFQQEIRALEKFKLEIGERAAKLQHANSQLQSDLRNALIELESRENKSSERENEKLHISRALQDLQSRFGDLRNDLKRKAEDLERADEDRASLREKVEMLSDQNRLQQDRLSSCQQDLEDARTQVVKLEKDLRNSKQENSRFYGTGGTIADSGRGASVTFTDRASTRNDQENLNGELLSPRKQKAAIAELKMKLAAKEAQIQRLEARVNNFTAEAERLEEIRGDLINVVERSRMGEKRAHELEGIVHQLEDERSKVTRQLMETEDKLNDKNAECESLESRLQERTKNLTRTQHDFEEKQRQLSKLESDLRKSSSDIEHLQKQLEAKTIECESRYAALQRAEDELAEKRRELDNAADWTGKREAESRREMERMKKIHQEQHQEMESQIEKLQSDSDRHREQARELECVVCQLRTENDTVMHRLKSAETDLEEARIQEESSRKKEQEALESLEKKAKESSEQVSSLQNALTQCKTEIRQYVEQLEEASSKFQHQMAVKNSQVAKLESELKITQDSLRCESLHAKALEANLEERQKMLEEASSRISELEDCQTCLQSKEAKLEQQLTRATSKSSQEREHWEGRLQAACCELEAKNRQFSQLNDALKDVDKEFGACRRELASVENQLSKLKSDSENKTKQLEEAQNETDKFKAELASKTQALTSLEEKLKTFENEDRELREKSLSQETELARCRAELQSLSQKGGHLQIALQTKDMDVLKKDTFIARLQAALKEAKEKLENKERQTEELERALEERQWELQQRAAQLGQLEVTVQEHKSNAEKKQIELQSDVRKAHIELKERNSQVSTLDDQLTSLREELSEQRHLADEKEQELRRVNREVEQREERIKDLDEALEESRKACEERHLACLEVTQELRVAREQSQRAAQQWQEAQRELSRLQRQQETLIGDLEDMGKTERQKETHVTELAGKLAATQAEKAGVEERYINELERMRNDVLKMHQHHQEEMTRLRQEHARQIMEAKTQAGDRSEDLKIAIEREKESRAECEAMRDVVTSLEQELLARKHVIEAANDTIVMKEAEIARLEARLSGIDRGKKMQNLQNSPLKTRDLDDHPDFLPSFLAREGSNSPGRGLEWRSPANVQGSPDPARGTSTLFSGLDPDSSSLDPSFLHIAASTQRPKATDNELARLMASSPRKELDLSNSTGDESLFTRVFNTNVAEPGQIDDLKALPNGSIIPERPTASGRQGSTKDLSFGLEPERCMADLQERLRASEQRRQEVTSKLRQLKSNGKNA